jgi:hypothetical protein
VTGRLNQPKALRRLEIDGPPVEPFECGLRVVPAIQAKRVAIEKPGRSGGLRLGARASTGLASAGRGVKHRICYKPRMHVDAAQPLLPIATLAAGVFLLVAPRIVSFAVAVYLIFVGLLGLNGIYHIVK